MGTWFALAALCVHGICTLYSLGVEDGYTTPELCEIALAHNWPDLPVDETLDAGGDYVGGCLPIGSVTKYTPEQMIDWLNGRAPGDLS